MPLCTCRFIFLLTADKMAEASNPHLEQRLMESENKWIMSEGDLHPHLVKFTLAMAR